jgi:hypothetical protein
MEAGGLVKAGLKFRETAVTSRGQGSERFKSKADTQTLSVWRGSKRRGKGAGADGQGAELNNS